MRVTRRNNRLQKKRHITNPRHQEKGPRGGRRVSGKGGVSVKRQRVFSNYNSNSKKKKSRVNRTCHNTKQKGGTNPHSTSRAQDVAQPRYIIITNGPTGSGKSTLKDKAIDGLYKRDEVTDGDFRKSFKPFLIDDMVEQHPYYKQELSNLLTKNNCTQTACDTKKLETDKEFINSINTVYFHTRQNKTCCADNKYTLSKMSDVPNETGACEDGYTSTNSVNDEFVPQIQQSIKDGENIVFETQGVDPAATVKWMKDMIELSEYDYKIIMAYSLVEYCELIKRNQTRFGSSVTAFLNDTQQPAPRLPDVQDGENSSFKGTYKKIRSGLLSEETWQSSDVTFFIVNNNNDTSVDSSGKLFAPGKGPFITEYTDLLKMVNNYMPDKDTTLCESTNVAAKAKL